MKITLLKTLEIPKHFSLHNFISQIFKIIQILDLGFWFTIFLFYLGSTCFQSSLEFCVTAQNIVKNKTEKSLEVYCSETLH